MKLLLSLLCLSTLVFASKAMSERMQSVVDEVTELRENYEDISRKYRSCQDELKKQENEMSKMSHHEGFDYEAFEKNREELSTLKAEYKEYESLCEKSKREKSTSIESLKLELQSSQEKNKTLESENNKLVKNSVSPQKTQAKTEDTPSFKALEKKNKSLENKLSISQKELLNLRAEIDKLKENRQTKITKKSKPDVRIVKEIKTKKVYVSACKDDNPFPKLMMKKVKKVSPLNEINTEVITTEKSHTYRMRVEAKIYNAINGDFIETWEEQTSFTSNLSKNGWIMITGYFINKKWVKAKAEIWVKAEDTLKR